MRILLQCDEGREEGGRTDCEIAEALDLGEPTVVRVRRHLVEEGLEVALSWKERVKEVRVPRPAEPGMPMTYDYECERNGVSNLFLWFAPLEGRRRVEVTERRTKVDWVRQVQQWVDEDYPDQRIVLVLDNLNTYATASLYEAFEPAEARRIAKCLEIHYTPKHDSWLNMAEVEISAMVGQCLNRRLPDR